MPMVAPRSGIGFFLRCYIAKGCFDLTLNPGFQFQDFVLPLWRTIGRKACKDFTCDTNSEQTKKCPLLVLLSAYESGGNQQDARYLGVPPQAQSYTKRSQAPWIIYKGSGKKLQMSF